MVKANAVKKEEALKLREQGIKIPEIVERTGLSRAVIYRLFKKNGVVQPKTRQVVSENETLPNKDAVEGNHEGEPIKNEIENENVNIKNEKRGTKSVRFDERSGAIVISENEEAVSYTKPIPETKNVKPEVTPGGGQAMKTAPETRKRDIDEPDNAIDNFFSRGLVETLVPLGLIVAGYMMKKEAEPSNVEYGEGVRKYGFGGWLKEGNSDW